MKDTKYTATARALHWAIAVLIVAAFALALSIDDMPLSPRKIRLINYHKWIGMTVFLLLVVRALWRLTHVPPALPDSVPRWQRLAAESAHGVLYILMALTPLVGWVLSSAKGFPVAYLGVIPLPDLVEKNKALAETLEDVHGVLGWALIVVAALHAAAALKHHYIDRDDVLRRMI